MEHPVIASIVLVTMFALGVTAWVDRQTNLIMIMGG